MLRKDKEEVEAIKHAKALEAEKAMYSVGPPPPSAVAPLGTRTPRCLVCGLTLLCLHGDPQGRRSRRQRREFREKRLKGRQISPPR
jgi:arginine/serine-rich splicing factor 16